MAERTSYEPGTPSYVDLATTDVDAAKAFYSGLFGWTYEDGDIPDGGTYTMVKKGDKVVAGLSNAMEGMPAAWSSYVSVTDVDATAAKVVPAGGQVLAGPFDVMTAGRMVVMMDPTGAVICAWQAKGSIGSEVVNEHGALTWNELISPDIPAAADFYAAVFDWKTEAFGEDYTVFNNAAGEGIAGGMKPMMPGMPAFWGVYFAVDDCDATVAAAQAAGASVLLPPTDMEGVGRLSALQDPQGVFFNVIKSAPDRNG